MKTIRIMGIMTMLCAMLGCKAQNEGYRSLTVEEYESAIADTVIELDAGFNGGQAPVNPLKNRKLYADEAWIRKTATASAT